MLRATDKLFKENAINMKILQYSVNDFMENTYILVDEATKECAIVDPGISTMREKKVFVHTIEKEGLKPMHLINTHIHVDHVIGNAFVCEKYGLRPAASKDDEFLALRVKEQAEMFGMPDCPENTRIAEYLNDGDVIKVGESSLQVLAVPGHSPGSIALYCKESGFVITGDALFARSIGRTDLPGGDYMTLVNAIKEKLLTLPDDTDVFPGHGPATTVGKEKEGNPYLK